MYYVSEVYWLCYFTHVRVNICSVFFLFIFYRRDDILVDCLINLFKLHVTYRKKSWEQNTRLWNFAKKLTNTFFHFANMQNLIFHNMDAVFANI